MKLKLIALLFLMNLLPIQTSFAVNSSVKTSVLKFPNSFIVADNDGDDTYMTTWTAYPIKVESYTGPNTDIPSSILITLTAEGKASSFIGALSWNCTSPKMSHIQVIQDWIYIDDAIEQDIIPRIVAYNMYETFCY